MDQMLPFSIHWIVYVLAYSYFIFEFKAFLALHKMACSAQPHKSISFIWFVWSTLYVYLCPILKKWSKYLFLLGPFIYYISMFWGVFRLPLAPPGPPSPLGQLSSKVSIWIDPLYFEPFSWKTVVFCGNSPPVLIGLILP